VPTFQLNSTQGARLLSGEFDYKNLGSDTFYYSELQTVSSGDTAVTSGSTLSQRKPVWVISAGASTVDQVTPGGATNSAWRTIDTQSAHLAGGTTAGTFVMYPTSSSNKHATDIVAGVFPIFQLVAADYSSAGRPLIRVRFTVASNATAPGTQTFTGGLYPVTVAGGAGAFTPTLGTVVAGTTAAVVNPAASTAGQVATSSEVAFPADGPYCLGFTSSATAAANSFTKLYAHLQVRNA
jgi:hypothetical protein